MKTKEMIERECREAHITKKDIEFANKNNLYYPDAEVLMDKSRSVLDYYTRFIMKMEAIDRKYLIMVLVNGLYLKQVANSLSMTYAYVCSNYNKAMRELVDLVNGGNQ